jgi:hypothetical protein
MRRTAATLGFLCAVTLAVNGQSARQPAATAPPPLSSMPGRVFASDTGLPLPNAMVTASSAGVNAAPVFSDGDGRFVLEIAGRSTLVVSKSGYSRQQLAVAPAQPEIEVRMSRTAAISGRVVDDLGEPALGMLILAESAPVAGANRSQTDAVAPARIVSTGTSDDRGEYRLVIPPGTSLSVSLVVPTVRRGFVRSDMDMSRPKVYYPGVTNAAEGEVFDLRPGEERAGVDFMRPSEIGLNPDNETGRNV